MAACINLEIQDKENRLKELKDEVQRLEFNIKMLKNSSSNTRQRKKFRRISKKDRQLSLLLKDLKEKAKDHRPVLYVDIKSVDEVRKSLSNDIESIMQLWYFNSDYLVKELGIDQNPTTIEEALDILPKLGINWPPTKNLERATEVSYPIIPFDGKSSKWSSERKSRLGVTESESKFLSLFQESISSQRNKLFRIGDLLNKLAWKLDPYNPQLSKLSIQFYKSQKNILFNNNIVLKNVCHNLEALLQGRVSDHSEAYNVRPSMTTSQPYSRPGPSGTNHNMPPMTTSQVYHLPGPSGTNNTRPSMSTSQVNCTSEPLGANTTRSTKTTGKENCEPGTPGTSNTTTSRTASQINQRKRKANQPQVDQSILTQAKQSRGIMGTIMSGIRNTHGTSKNNIW